MKKKSNTDKNLRRKVEILKAQLASSKDVYIPQPQLINKNQNTTAKQTVEIGSKIDSNLIKRDLLKTFLLSMLAFSIILTIKIL